jgi:hypothetical protein
VTAQHWLGLADPFFNSDYFLYSTEYSGSMYFSSVILTNFSNSWKKIPNYKKNTLAGND